jgi:hypothetical protein
LKRHSESVSRFSFLFAHDLFGKPLHTFPDHAPELREVAMNEDVFNNSLRRFLKKVGVTSQREIEKSVRDALASGRLKGHEKLPAKMVLTIGGVSLSHEIADEIELG